LAIHGRDLQPSPKISQVEFPRRAKGSKGATNICLLGQSVIVINHFGDCRPLKCWSHFGTYLQQVIFFHFFHKNDCESIDQTLEDLFVIHLDGEDSERQKP